MIIVAALMFALPGVREPHPRAARLRPRAAAVAGDRARRAARSAARCSASSARCSRCRSRPALQMVVRELRVELPGEEHLDAESRARRERRADLRGARRGRDRSRRPPRSRASSRSASRTTEAKGGRLSQPSSTRSEDVEAKERKTDEPLEVPRAPRRHHRRRRLLPAVRRGPHHRGALGRHPSGVRVSSAASRPRRDDAGPRRSSASRRRRQAHGDAGPRRQLQTARTAPRCSTCRRRCSADRHRVRHPPPDGPVRGPLAILGGASGASGRIFYTWRATTRTTAATISLGANSLLVSRIGRRDWRPRRAD